jgi:hypothetical protein
MDRHRRQHGTWRVEQDVSASYQALTPLAIAAELVLHGNREKGRFSVMSFRCLVQTKLSHPKDFVMNIDVHHNHPCACRRAQGVRGNAA